MGQAQTHLESKVFDDTAPPWDLEAITGDTDLSEEEVNACWRMWVQHPLVQKGQLRERDFYKVNHQLWPFCAVSLSFLDTKEGEAKVGV